MNELFKALSNNPIAIITLIASFGIIVLSLVMTYLIAFFQGREVHFWPPKIGAKPETSKEHKAGESKEKGQSTCSASHFLVVG